MIYNIAIDADSLIYKSCYRHQIHHTKDTPYTNEEILASFDLEKAYFEFCQEIGKIRSAPFTGTEPILEYKKGDDVQVKIVFSPRKSFRNDIYPMYKANRAKRPSTVVGIKDLKLLVLDRLADWTVLIPNIEADDIVNYYAREFGYLVSAIDKDVINANPTNTYNYNEFKWYPPNSELNIEKWYIKQALMGDNADNIKGAKGVGEVGADKIVAELDFPINFEDVVEHFTDETDAYLNYWLVRMDQFNGKEMILWKM